MKQFLKTRTQLFTFAAIAFLSGAMIITACQKEKDPLVVGGPQSAPNLPQQPYNYTFGDDHLATLGRVLFYDKALSLNNTISCGSCHKQQHAFADNRRFSRGLFNGFTSRNSSMIFSGNATFMSGERHKFWDGRAGSTDSAVFMPVMNELEMHTFDLNLLPGKLSGIDYYPQLFENAFGSPEITVAGIRTALSSFVDNLVTMRSKFDLDQMSALEHEGRELFEGKANCYGCHNGPDFNGYETHYQSIGLEVNYADQGRGYITNQEGDMGRFMVPTLRNIEHSAPYMHDGRFNTLRDVIDHYDHGVQDHRNLGWALRDIPEIFFDTTTAETESEVNLQAFPVKRLNLSEHEKQALEAFLKALSDPEFLTDPRYSDPFR